jgi:hypothetical protein
VEPDRVLTVLSTSTYTSLAFDRMMRKREALYPTVSGPLTPRIMRLLEEAKELLEPAVAKGLTEFRLMDEQLDGAASAPRPGASGKSTATTTDDVFDIEPLCRTRVEALSDLQLQPGDSFGPSPLMRDG